MLKIAKFVNCINFPMIQAVINKTFRGSTDKRTKGKSKDSFRYDLNINKHTEMAKNK